MRTHLFADHNKNKKLKLNKFLNNIKFKLK